MNNATFIGPGNDLRVQRSQNDESSAMNFWCCCLFETETDKQHGASRSQVYEFCPRSFTHVCVSGNLFWYIPKFLLGSAIGTGIVICYVTPAPGSQNIESSANNGETRQVNCWYSDSFTAAASKIVIGNDWF